MPTTIRRAGWGEVYAAVMATAGSTIPVAVPLNGEPRNVVQARIRAYLADHGYRLKSSVAEGVLWCLAERTERGR